MWKPEEIELTRILWTETQLPALEIIAKLADEFGYEHSPSTLYRLVVAKGWPRRKPGQKPKAPEAETKSPEPSVHPGVAIRNRGLELQAQYREKARKRLQNV
jgi:hypothetical protein